MEKKELVFVLVVSLVLFFCLFDYAPVTGFFISGTVISPKITPVEEYDYEISEKITLDVETPEEGIVGITYTANFEESVFEEEQEIEEEIDVLIYNPNSNLAVVSSIKPKGEKKILLDEEEIDYGLWDVFFIDEVNRIECVNLIVDDEGNILICKDKDDNEYFESDGDIHKLTPGGLETTLGEGKISEDSFVVFFNVGSELLKRDYFVVDGGLAETNEEKIKLIEEKFKKLQIEENPEILKLALNLENEESRIIGKVMKPLGLKPKTTLLPREYDEKNIIVRKVSYEEQLEEKELNYEFEIGEGGYYSTLNIGIEEGIPKFNLVI